MNGWQRVELDPEVVMELMTTVPRGHAVLYSRTKQHFRVAVARTSDMHQLARLQWHVSHVANRAFQAALADARQWEWVTKITRAIPPGTAWEWIHQKEQRSKEIRYKVRWFQVTDFGNKPLVVVSGPDGKGYGTAYEALQALYAVIVERMQWSDYREMKKRNLAKLVQERGLKPPRIS
jgi:hypothetical protein